MDERIGQLLRFFGLPVEMPKTEIGGEPKKKSEAIESPPAEPHEPKPHRTSEESVVLRFEANPFLEEHAPSFQDEPIATQLAEEPAVVAEQPRQDEVTEKTETYIPESDEPQELEETREAEASHDQPEEEEEARAGAGMLRDEAASEESPESKGLRHANALGDEQRCHGVLHDGTRCLRRPVEGKAYCREHAAGSVIFD